MRTSPTMLLLAATLAACGSLARGHALWPAVKLAWPGVRADIDSSPLFPAGQVALLDSAVQADDWTMVSAADPVTIDSAARAGIRAHMDAGEIGPAVASSKIERLDQFVRAIRALQEHLR